MSKYDFKLDDSFIKEHLDELIHLVDYVPFSFADYNAEKEREEFLKSENLLSKMQDMDQLINAKCNYYEDSIEARNSVIIEWLDCHPEFEGILSKESFQDYQNMKNNENFIEFIDLLEDVIIENKQALEMVEMHRNILENMMDAFASIISNNLNKSREISNISYTSTDVNKVWSK